MSCNQAQDAGEGQSAAESSMPKKRIVRRADKSKCGRCREARSMYIIRSMPYCQECFLSNFGNRIMRRMYPPLHAAGPSKISYGLSRPRQVSGSVLVPVSGGAGSMSLLDVLRRHNYVGDGQRRVADKTTGEKEAIWDHGTLLYVEFAAVTGMVDRMEIMRELAKRMSMKFVGVRAEDVFGNETGSSSGTSDTLKVNLNDASLPVGREPDPGPSRPCNASVELRRFVAGLPEPSRPALLEQILQNAIRQTALDDSQISHILVGETSTRESERVISGTALGRGWSLPLELGTAELIHAPSGRQIQRIKPMKDITVREAAVYCHLRKVGTRNDRSWASGHTPDKAASSLEALTENFIARLDVTHPSTVSTINKTGEKLRFTGDRGTSMRCPVCDAPAQPSALAWKSRTALTTLGKVGSDGRREAETPHLASLAEYLCYACLTMFTPSSSRKGQRQPADTVTDGPVALPNFIRQGYDRRRELDTRTQISQYLLYDDQAD